LSDAQIFQNFVDQRDGVSDKVTIVPQETSEDQAWRCSVTPNDGWQDGASALSNQLTIVSGNTRPRIDWYSPVQPELNVIVGDSIDFKQISSDPNGSPLTYSWTLDSVQMATTQDWTFVAETALTHAVRVTTSDGTSTDYQEWIVNVNEPTSQFNLQIEVNGQGTTDPAVGTYQYDSGTPVQVTANAGANYQFDHWLLNGTNYGTTNPCSITMNSNYVLTAVFTATPPPPSVQDCLVVRGTDNNMYYRTYDGTTWNGWQVIPGQTYYEPAAAIYDGKLHVAIIGPMYNAIYWGSVDLTTGEFSGWEWIQGASDSTPALGALDEGLCLVVRGTDSNLYYRTYDGTIWSSSWQIIPGQTNYEPAAAFFDGKLQVAIIGPMYNAIYWGSVDLTNNQFSGWTWIQGGSDSTPSLSASDNKLCLVVRGTDNLLYYRSFDGSTWTPGWSLIPGETLYEPAAVGVGNRLDVAIVGMQYNAIYYGSVNLSSGEFSGWTWIPGASDSTPALA
jgi:hypothetical protein